MSFVVFIRLCHAHSVRFLACFRFLREPSGLRPIARKVALLDRSGRQRRCESLNKIAVSAFGVGLCARLTIVARGARVRCALRLGERPARSRVSRSFVSPPPPLLLHHHLALCSHCFVPLRVPFFLGTMKEGSQLLSARASVREPVTPYDRRRLFFCRRGRRR